MGIPVLIIGKSGSGKSTSLRNCCNDNWNIIRVLNKPLPFRGHIKGIRTDKYDVIRKGLVRSTAKSIVIDDAGYLITNGFMREHSQPKSGNGYDLYNRLADQFWELVMSVQGLPPDKIVYIMMHEDVGPDGAIKSKTIGKLLDDKVCVEGLFTIVFRCIIEGENHLFVTQSSNGAVSKSPMGMFESLTIDNDLALVDKTIREYYELEASERPEDKPDESGAES